MKIYFDKTNKSINGISPTFSQKSQLNVGRPLELLTGKVFHNDNVLPEQEDDYGTNYGWGELLTVIAGGKMYTFDDILALPEGERAELIDGEMFMMASPTQQHEDAVMWMSCQIFNYIQGKKGRCRVYASHFAVFPKKDNKNYVEPDVTVVCDWDKLDMRGCNGAPEWVIEVVSPSSVKMDYERKKKLYQESGVEEYWIVDLEKERVRVYRFSEDAQEKDYSFTDTVKVGIYEDLQFDLKGLKEYLEGSPDIGFSFVK